MGCITFTGYPADAAYGTGYMIQWMPDDDENFLKKGYARFIHASAGHSETGAG